MRLGILGGTLDPIHQAHLFIAEEARVRYTLEQVLFIPNGVPAHKEQDEVAPALHRLEMTQLAIATNPAFACSSIEIDRPGPSFAVDTLTELKARYPGADLFFISGIDAVAEIETWRRYDEVLRLCTFIAAERPGYDFETLRLRLHNTLLERILPLPTLYLEISATDIRRRVAEGCSIRYLTPDAVVAYIAEHELYRP